jgi:hypothetical protein
VNISFEVVKIGWFEMYQEEEIETLYRNLIETIGPELMHNSEEWACFQCGVYQIRLFPGGTVIHAIIDSDPATDISWISIYTQGEKVYKRCKIIVSSLTVVYILYYAQKSTRLAQDVKNAPPRWKRERYSSRRKKISVVPRVIPSSLLCLGQSQGPKG